MLFLLRKFYEYGLLVYSGEAFVDDFLVADNEASVLQKSYITVLGLVPMKLKRENI